MARSTWGRRPWRKTWGPKARWRTTAGAPVTAATPNDSARRRPDPAGSSVIRPGRRAETRNGAPDLARSDRRGLYARRRWGEERGARGSGGSVARTVGDAECSLPRARPPRARAPDA